MKEITTLKSKQKLMVPRTEKVLNGPVDKLVAELAERLVGINKVASVSSIGGPRRGESVHAAIHGRAASNQVSMIFFNTPQSFVDGTPFRG